MSFDNDMNLAALEFDVQAALDQLQARAVVEVDIALQAVVRQHLAAHLVGVVDAHIVDGRTRELQHHGRTGRLGGLRDAHEGLVVIKVGSQDRGLLGQESSFLMTLMPYGTSVQ